MANIINADNGVVSGVAGIKTSADTSGVLNIQTNGTTAISISTAQVVSFPATSGISFGGQITFAAGTAAAPSISVTGDTNTGIYFPGTDQVAITTAGTQRVLVDASGVMTLSANPTLSGGTANGVLYLNASKVATSGSALTFDGTRLLLGTTVNGGMLTVKAATNTIYGEFDAVSDGFGYLTFKNNGTACGYVGPGSLTTGNQMAIASAGALPITFGINGAEAMRLTSTGLGIGTSSPGAKLEVRANIAGGSDNTVAILHNYSDTGGDTRYSGLTFRIGSDNGTSAIRAFRTNSSNNYETNLTFWTNPSGATQTPVQRATIDSSGNLGVGTTSPGYRLHVSQTSGNDIGFFGTSAGGGGRIAFSDGNSGTAASVPRIGANANDMLFYTNTSGNNATERARITSGGDFAIGKTAASESYTSGNGYGFAAATTDPFFSIVNVNGSGANGCIYLNRRNVGSASLLIAFLSNNGSSQTSVGSITHNGTNTAYNTGSDRRLKKNVLPANEAGIVIDAIDVVQFDWKVGGHTRYGMIAQDLYKVAPEAVAIGDPDDVEELKTAWGVDYSKLVPMLVKELQSVRARLAALESK